MSDTPARERATRFRITSAHTLIDGARTYHFAEGEVVTATDPRLEALLMRSRRAVPIPASAPTRARTSDSTTRDA